MSDGEDNIYMTGCYNLLCCYIIISIVLCGSDDHYNVHFLGDTNYKLVIRVCLHNYHAVAIKASYKCTVIASESSTVGLI